MVGKALGDVSDCDIGWTGLLTAVTTAGCVHEPEVVGKERKNTDITQRRIYAEAFSSCALVATLALAGCGGGGDSSGSFYVTAVVSGQNMGNYGPGTRSLAIHAGQSVELDANEPVFWTLYVGNTAVTSPGTSVYYAGVTIVSAWARHLEMTWPVAEHRVYVEHGGCLGEGGGVCVALARRCRAGRVRSRSSGSRVGAAPGVKQVELSRLAATDGAATPRSGCSTAWAVG